VQAGGGLVAVAISRVNFGLQMKWRRDGVADEGEKEI